MNLRGKTIKGLAWTAVDRWLSQALTFVIFLILARLLSPKAFGLVALASTFTYFVQLFLDQGMTQALIQFDVVESRHLDTAFWTGILTAVLITVAGVALSGVVSEFFREPSLKPIVLVLSLGFPISALSSVQQAFLQRNLEFRRLAVRSIIAKICGGVFGITSAILGFGAWSLVIQTLTFSLAEVLTLWSVSHWRPSFNFSAQHFKTLFNFGISTIGVRVLEYLDMRFDDLVIGYFLGAVALGFYTIAFKILRMLMDILTGISSSVTFPVLSRLQNEPARLRAAFFQIIKYSNVIVWPVFLGAAVLAPELVLALFGPQWGLAVPAMQLLLIGGVLFCSLQYNGGLAWALGKPDMVLRARTSITLLRIVAYVVVVRWGFNAVAGAYSFVVYAAFAPIYIGLARKLIKFRLKEYMSLFTKPVLSSLAMAALLLREKQYVSAAIPSIYGQLAIYISSGLLVHACLMMILWPALPGDLWSLCRPLIPRFVKVG